MAEGRQSGSNSVGDQRQTEPTNDQGQAWPGVGVASPESAWRTVFQDPGSSVQQIMKNNVQAYAVRDWGRSGSDAGVTAPRGDRAGGEDRTACVCGSVRSKQTRHSPHVPRHALQAILARRSLLTKYRRRWRCGWHAPGVDTAR